VPRVVAAVLALLAGCTPAHDARWAEDYLIRDPLGADAGEAFRLLVVQAQAPVLRVRPRFNTVVDMY
jgi:hypothetical protein